MPALIASVHPYCGGATAGSRRCRAVGTFSYSRPGGVPATSTSRAVGALHNHVYLRTPSRKIAAQAHSGDLGSEFGDANPFNELSDFERETQVVLTRVLTARATQLVLVQLNTASPQIYEWLSNFTRECPPIEGDEFVLKLMKRQPYTSIDPVTKNTMIIHPVTLAQQVLAVREELADASAKGLAYHVKNANLDVIKTHLNQNHYTLSHKVAPVKKGAVRQRDGQAEAGHAGN